MASTISCCVDRASRPRSTSPWTAIRKSVAEIGFWIEQAARFDFSRSGLQMEERANWFGDLGVSYHVGVYGFSLWLVGMTVVVLAASIIYGWWAGRERARNGKLLLLTAR